MAEFKYQNPFPLGEDNTEYELLTTDYVSTEEFNGRKILKIDPGAKVIISSGNPIDSVMTNFHEHGFKAAIGKPIALAELNATINFVLDVDKG